MYGSSRLCVCLGLSKSCCSSGEGKTTCTAITLQVTLIHQRGCLLMKGAISSPLQPDCRQQPDSNLMQVPVCLQAGEPRHQVNPTLQPVDWAPQPALHSSLA